MNKNSKAAFTSVEMTICIPLLMLLVLVITLFSARIVLKIALDAESFAQARAHLYGNDQELCRPTKYWPESIKPQMVCSKNGSIHSELKLSRSFKLISEFNLDRIFQ